MTMSRRRRNLRPSRILRIGLPTVEVIGLHEYRRNVMVSLGFDNTLIPSSRVKEFPLGKKFKLVPLP